MNMLNNKTVWITGASSGIGRALAVQCARAGAKLILSGRNNENLAKTADLCRAYTMPGEPLTKPFDISAHETFPDIVKEVLDRTGGIDILVNNAGLGQRSTALSCTPETVKKIMEVNFFGTVFLTQAVLPSMLLRGSGHIVVVSSVLGKFHLPGRSAYSASKHALHGYFDTLRTELHYGNIKITIVRPGWIATEISKNALTESGEAYGKNSGTVSKNKMGPDVCATKILRAVVSGKQEASMGGLEIWGSVLRTFLPGLFDRVARLKASEFVEKKDSQHSAPKTK